MIGLSAVRAHLTPSWQSKLAHSIFPGDAEVKEDCQTVSYAWPHNLKATLGWNREQVLENFKKAYDGADRTVFNSMTTETSCEEMSAIWEAWISAWDEEKTSSGM